MSKRSTRKEKDQILKLSDYPNEKDFEISCGVESFKPRTKNQALAYEMLQNNSINFLIGTVGSGKSHLAVHYALNQLLSKKIKQIVLIRPATVNSFEQLGFLKGDMQEKISPLVLPMKKIAEDLIGKIKFQELMDQEKIQPYALAYIEGMTYKNSIILLDEFQNTIPSMLQAFLTRIDDSSQAIVMGDKKQIKLDDPTLSASHDIERFKGVKGIGFMEFEECDIVRGKITKIVESCYSNKNTPINLPTKNKNINDTYIANWY